MPIKIHELIVRVNVDNRSEQMLHKNNTNKFNNNTINSFSTHHLKNFENSITHKYDDKRER